MGEKHGGVLSVSCELLLRWLDFAEATVRDARYNFASDSIDLTLEADELPLIKQGEYPPRIIVSYIQYQDAMGNKVVIRKRD